MSEKKPPVLDLREKEIVRPGVRLDSGEYQMLAFEELRPSSYRQIAKLSEQLTSGELDFAGQAEALLSGVHSLCIDMPTEVVEKLSIDDLTQILTWWIANAGFPSTQTGDESEDAEADDAR